MHNIREEFSQFILLCILSDGKERTMKFLGKHLKKILIILLMIILFSGATVFSLFKEEEASTTVFLFDTIIKIKAYGNNSNAAVKSAVQRITEIENKMSAYKEDSEISNINKNGYKNDIVVSEDTFKVLEKSLYYSNITQGHFDITVKPLMDLWGFGTGEFNLPDEESIKNTISYVGYQHIRINPENLSVSVNHNKVGIDLGAIAKGYAGDEVIRILKENGIESAFVDLGGNIVVMGEKRQSIWQELLNNIFRRNQALGENKKWKIGIQDPVKQRGSPMAAIEVNNKAIVSSGAYERNFEYDGRLYHHIINPFTGYPAKSGLISVTIISEQSIEADALSTGVYVMGEDKGLKLIESIPGVEVIMINDRNEVIVSQGLKNKVEILSPDYYMK